MKKRMMALMTLAMSMAASTAVWAGVFDSYYDYQNPDGTYSYYFSDGETSGGIFVTMDEDWYQNTFVKTKDSGVTFYHKDSYEAYEEEEGFEGGRLFTIGACVNSSFQDLPSYEYIGFDDELCMNIYAELPTDYQAYMGDEAVRAEYDALWAGVRDVIAGIRIGNATDDTGSQEPSPAPSTESTLSTMVPDDDPVKVITSGDYEYIVNGDAETVTINEYIGNSEVVEIPSEIDGYRVTDIGPKAFSYRKMKQLTLPEGLRTIGQSAFEYCEMPEVVIPAGATVGICAFGYCDGLKQVMIDPDAVIESRAFGYCDDLETVVCAAGSRLEANTFEYCDKLSQVVLCGEVELEEKAFYDCEKAQMITAPEEEYDSRKQSGRNTVSSDADITSDPASFLTGGSGRMPETEALAAGEHRITATGNPDVFVDYPDRAKTGDTVTVHTVGVADGEVKIEVNGADTGKWEDWGTYTFTMPDEDVEINGWISTEGYPGA